MDREDDDGEEEAAEELDVELPKELGTGLGEGLGAEERPVPTTLAGPVTDTAGLCTWTELV